MKNTNCFAPDDTSPVHAPASTGAPAQAHERLMSIDALRGFDMFLIIGGGPIIAGLVNGIGNEALKKTVLPQLKHVPWEGFAFWDLLMPLFLFLVGVSMPFSFSKRLGQQGTARLYRHIIIRVLILFALGLVAQGNLLDYDLSTLHIYCNTLQAIAAGYLIASIIVLNTKLVLQVVITGALLLAFWALMMFVPVPEHGAGVLTPEGNLAIYLDKLILGRFQDQTSYTWILSSLTFACTVMLGAFAGQTLRCRQNPFIKVLMLLVMGGACLGLGLVWNASFPIIKHLWTSSCVLFAGGLSFLLLALFYLVIDVLHLRLWAYGWVVIGMNAIFAYMAVHLINFRTIGGRFVENLAPWLGQWNDLVQASAAFAVLWLILHYMYRKKTFIKI